VGSLVLSYLLFDIVRTSVQYSARVRFEQEATDLHSIISQRLRSYSDVLYSLRALFATDDVVDRRRFHSFAVSLDLTRRYPGFIALNYAQYVRGVDRASFEASVRADNSLNGRGYLEFVIKPPGERPEYFVIVYIEPMAGYEFAHGLDLGANPMAEDPSKVVAAIHLQRDSGNLLTSAQRLKVPRRGESVFLAMRLAVYQNGKPLSTVDERRAAYMGSVGAGFDVEYLLKDSPTETAKRSIRVQLFDAGLDGGGAEDVDRTGMRLLFDSASKASQLSTEESDPSFESPVVIAGRVWHIRYSMPKSLMLSTADRLFPAAILGGGAVVSLLLFGVLYFMGSARARAVTLAQGMTLDLRRSTEQLQALSKRLVDMQELERREISRELHDRVGQNLTAMSFSVSILRSQLPHTVEQAVHTRLDDLDRLVATTTKTIESVMIDMRPPMLDDYGLLAALQWYCSEFSARFDIQVSIEGDNQVVRMSPEKEIGLFRVVQEALNNVAKHAHATLVKVLLEQSDSEVSISIIDNGIGYAASASARAQTRRSLGMVTMRERIQSLGGTFEVGRPRYAVGAKITVRVPC